MHCETAAENNVNFCVSFSAVFSGAGAQQWAQDAAGSHFEDSIWYIFSLRDSRCSDKVASKEISTFV
jgi:hypothetical protein